MPNPPQRSATRTETPEDVAALATQVRDVAGALGDLYERAQGLSKPIFMTGWTRPIATVQALAQALQDWAELLDAQAGNAPST